MRSFFLLMTAAFLLITGIAYWLFRQGQVPDFNLLLTGNIILALVTVTNFFIITRAAKSDNPSVLVRAKTAGAMLKFFVAVGALLLYIFVNNRIINKPTIFIFLGIYLVYTVIETVKLSRIVKGKP